MKSKAHFRFYTNLFLTSVLMVGGSFSLAKASLAEGTSAGTPITNTATGSFEGFTSGTLGTVTSNTVTLSVLEVTGITLAASGLTQPSTTVGNGLNDIWASLTAGPYQGVEGINRGDIVYFDFTITNTGNSPTAFFIPDSVTPPTGGTQRGIRVIEVDPDGAGTATPTTMSVNVPSGGALTTATGFLPTPATDGYIPVNGTVKVRVAVEITGLNVGDTTTVVFGNTVAVGDQNQDYVASTAPARDVYTEDLPGVTAIPTAGYQGAGYINVAGIDQTVETAGLPVNGDATTRRKEASATQSTAITAGIDYGDAPNSFKTVLNSATGYSGSGASHIIDNTIKMGTAVTDAEADGVAATSPGDAVDDDNAGTDDEDGVTLLTNATTYTATVNVTNTSGSPAYLVGWIDFNKDGIFDPSEAQVFDQANNTSTAIPPTAAGSITTITPIPSGTNAISKTLTWSVPTGLVTGSVLYARFRLTTDLSVIGSLTVSAIAAKPNTPLGKGEVEDYRIIVGVTPSNPKLLLVKRITAINGSLITNVVDDGFASSPDDNINWVTGYLKGDIIRNGVKPGDRLEYTIYFLSAGDTDITNVTICDLIPPNTTFVNGAYDSVGNSSNLGMVFANSTSITYLTGLFDGDPGKFYPPNTLPPTTCKKPPTNTPLTAAHNTDGLVVVDVVTSPAKLPFAKSPPGTPSNSYGFVRFTVTVN